MSFTLREATTREQVEALELGRADIGLMRHPGVSAPSLHFETLLSEPVLIALPASHRLAECDVVELAALREDAFVASARTLGPGFHDQLVSLCLAAGFAPRVAQEARRLETVVALVAGGFGAACCQPRWRASRAAMCVPTDLGGRAGRCGGWICCWPGGLVTPRRYGIR